MSKPHSPKHKDFKPSLSYWLLNLGKRANQVKNMVFFPPVIDLTTYAEIPIHRSPSFGDDRPPVVKACQRDLVLV